MSFEALLDSALKIQQGQWRIQDFPKARTPTPTVDLTNYYLAIFSQKLHEIQRIWTPL